MVLYKLNDEEYKLLMQMNKRYNQKPGFRIIDNIVKDNGEKYYNLEKQNINDVYFGAKFAGEKIGEEWEQKFMEVYEKMERCKNEGNNINWPGSRDVD